MTSAPVTSITEDLLAELEQLAGKATPGPWHVVISDNGTPFIQHESGEDWTDINDRSSRVCLMPAEIVENFNAFNNAKHAAAAKPATILALLQHVRELGKDRERLDYLEAAYGGHTGHDGGFRVSLYLPDKDNLREMVDAAIGSKGEKP